MIIAVKKQEKGKVWILRATIDSDIFDFWCVGCNLAMLVTPIW